MMPRPRVTISVLMGMISSEILRLPACSKFDGEFSIKIEGKVLANHVLTSLRDVTFVVCVFECVTFAKCKSVNFLDASNVCELNSGDSADLNVTFQERLGWTYFETPKAPAKKLGPNCQQISPCQHGTCRDTCEAPGYTCSCDDPYVGSHCDKKRGSTPEQADLSCLQIRRRYGNERPPSGMYWIKLSQPVQMFCDMEVAEGGWTKVGNANITRNDFVYSTANVHDDLETLSHTETTYYALSTIGLAKLREYINFTSVRVYCYKTSVDRTFHIYTVNTSIGLAVVDYMTGKSAIRPRFCESFIRLPTDDSILSRACSRWPNHEWSYDTIYRDILLYDHVVYISNERHLIAGNRQGRFECDDFSSSDKIGIWSFFVR